MENYVSIVKIENNLSVCFYNSSEKVVAIAKKMNEINEEAYMHGYNWEAFFNYYLPKYAPDVLEGMGSIRKRECMWRITRYHLKLRHEQKNLFK